MKQPVGGSELSQVQLSAHDMMAKNKQFGFISFESRINAHVPVARLAANRFVIAEAVPGVRRK